MIEDLIKKRKKLRVSARQIGEMIGYTKDWIYKFERGERRISKDFLTKYEQALKKYEELLK